MNIPIHGSVRLLSVTVLLAFTAKISCRNMEFKLIHFCFLFYSVGNYFLLYIVFEHFIEEVLEREKQTLYQIKDHLRYYPADLCWPFIKSLMMMMMISDVLSTSSRENKRKL